MLRYSPILPEKAYIILWSLRTLTSQKRDRPCAHGSHTSSAVRGWEREDGTQVDCTIVNAAGRHICSDYISVLLCLRLCVLIMDKPTEYKSKHRPTTVLETHLQQARICTQSPDSLGFAKYGSDASLLWRLQNRSNSFRDRLKIHGKKWMN